ncbi:hypothetical protein KKE60_07990 [Patescibacteria group bacterium]|nr:hypothetical protein [Patescibacteria group bacterium]
MRGNKRDEAKTHLKQAIGNLYKAAQHIHDAESKDIFYNVHARKAISYIYQGLGMTVDLIEGVRNEITPRRTRLTVARAMAEAMAMVPTSHMPACDLTERYQALSDGNHNPGKGGISA